MTKLRSIYKYFDFDSYEVYFLVILSNGNDIITNIIPSEKVIEKQEIMYNMSKKITYVQDTIKMFCDVDFFGAFKLNAY